eukprot:TRINITY_DN24232_c0_g1_i1.p1 TRINITY_DN24232_c0_g1~~TRINITY_DN24232_c0_g1_i1.p1  ORF type:complete len:638 (+),score=321.65 TRINITY_DN24232_c0_g1_i1:221-2134(+)
MSKSQSFAAQKKEEAGRLFAELNKEEDTKKALQLCDHILKLLPGDEDAVAMKVHKMIDSNRYPEAVKFLEGESEKVQKRHALYLAYAYYRVNKLPQAEESLALCAKSEETAEAVRHLMAQIQYKKESYDVALKTLQEQRDAQGEVDEEILCNLSAAAIGAGNHADALKLLNMPDGDLTHDLLCNKACVYIQQQQWDRAESALRAAEKDMKEFHMEGGEIDQESLADDLASVRVQMAYIASQQDDNERAASILNEVMKKKPTSLSTLAVASNNLCALQQKDWTVFDAFKRMKPLRGSSIDSKLSTSQRLAVRFNTSILMGLLGQKVQGKALADSIVRDEPSSPLGPIALASILCQENKFGKAEELLRTHLEKHGAKGDVTDLLLLKAQVHLKQGDLRRAVEALKGVDKMKHELGLAATLVSANERQGNIDAALEVLDQAIAYWKESSDSRSADNVATLTEESGKLLLKHQRWEEAATRFKAAQKLGRTDSATTARLGMCLAHIDVNAAETLCNELDQAGETSEITPAEAEELLALKVRELTASQSPVAEVVTPAKKKRLRPKGKKPENATGEPDPERWWAQKERASYKALSKRQVREQKKERIEAKNRRQRQLASEREALRTKLRVHYEAMREQEKAQ